TIHSVEEYTRMLLDHSFRPNVWETTYHQVLSGPDPVFDWVKGAALRPVLQKLAEYDNTHKTSLYDSFVARYKAEMLDAYPPYVGPDGQAVTVYPFRRIFVVGHKELDYLIETAAELPAALTPFIKVWPFVTQNRITTVTGQHHRVVVIDGKNSVGHIIDECFEAFSIVPGITNPTREQ